MGAGRNASLEGRPRAQWPYGIQSDERSAKRYASGTGREDAVPGWHLDLPVAVSPATRRRGAFGAPVTHPGPPRGPRASGLSRSRLTSVPAGHAGESRGYRRRRSR